MKFLINIFNENSRNAQNFNFLMFIVKWINKYGDRFKKIASLLNCLSEKLLSPIMYEKFFNDFSIKLEGACESIDLMDATSLSPPVLFILD